MEFKFRCDCPFTSAIDILGDKWMLVIIKQMLVERKQTFKEFIESSEAIATNILTIKLKLLEELGIISKSKAVNNKKTNLYHLSEKGLALAPLLAELATWSDQNLRDLNPTIQEGEGMKLLRHDKSAFVDMLVTGYKNDVLNQEYSS